MTTCPTCGQPLHEMRLGVKMTALKARIFDIIRRSGEEGISTDAMSNMLAIRPATIKAHVWQINEMLENAGWKIAQTIPRYGYRLYHLENIKQQTENGK